MVVSNLFVCFVMVFCNNYMYLSGHNNAQFWQNAMFFLLRVQAKKSSYLNKFNRNSDSEAVSENLKSMKIKKRIFTALTVTQ